MLLSVDADVWSEEAALIAADYEHFGDRLPAELARQLEALNRRLADADLADDDDFPRRIALTA